MPLNDLFRDIHHHKSRKIARQRGSLLPTLLLAQIPETASQLLSLISSCRADRSYKVSQLSLPSKWLSLRVQLQFAIGIDQHQQTIGRSRPVLVVR